jgi:hypothetical protein
MRTLYFKPRLARTLPTGCCVVNVSPLLKELVLHACQFPSLKMRLPWQKHLIDMILDQLKTIRLLAEGAKVTHAALDAGYNSASAFISMFRKTLGTTPALYFQAAGTRGGNA